MCTAVTFQTKDFYFGRTLDHDCAFGEEVTITPRNFPLTFREVGTLESHYAIIGMAHVLDGYPLYYDGVNEKGLAMAGLNFEGFAEYQPSLPGWANIASFELLPWILAQCASVSEAVKCMEGLNLTDAAFREDLPPSPLHWLLADREQGVTVEAMAGGLRIHPNPVGVLTNSPPFEAQLFQLNNYMHLSAQPPGNRFSPKLELKPYSRGMGALGLPGDLSSQSRFVRAAFVKLNSQAGTGEGESVGQFFHILESVTQPRGCCDLGDGKYETTLYSACCNTDRGIYYYTTYGNHRITGVDMYKENMDGSFLVRYPLISGEQIHMQN